MHFYGHIRRCNFHSHFIYNNNNNNNNNNNSNNNGDNNSNIFTDTSPQPSRRFSCNPYDHLCTSYGYILHAFLAELSLVSFVADTSVDAFVIQIDFFETFLEIFFIHIQNCISY
jgi:hypothetical protein